MTRQELIQIKKKYARNDIYLEMKIDKYLEDTPDLTEEELCENLKEFLKTYHKVV